MCRLAQGCHECDSDQSQMTQLRNLKLAGLSGTPKHWRLQRACNLLHNDWHYAMSIYRERRNSGWSFFDCWGTFFRELLAAIYGNTIDPTEQQGASWEQYAADPPPVLIMYRSFIAQTTTNTDPPRAAHGIRREHSVITCAGHC
jgi:hypothetical protein